MTNALTSLLAVAGLFLNPIQSYAQQDIYDLSLGDPSRKDRQATVVLDGITDTRTGEVIAANDLPEKLKDVRVLLIGEEHTNLEFHRVQEKVIETLVNSGREVIIGLEMFPHTAQKALDDWSRGKLSEPEFLNKADWYGNWSHPWPYYKAIFQLAKDRKIRLYGVNVPREVVKKARQEGFKDIASGVENYVPPKFDTSSDEHRKLFRAYFGPQDTLHGSLSDEQFEALFRSQVTWDGSMAWNAIRVLNKHASRDAIVVVLIGSGHVAYGLGAQRQAAVWSDEPVATLIPVSVVDHSGQAVKQVNAAYANFVWGVPRDTLKLPEVGVLLGGSISKIPTKVIAVDEKSPASTAGLAVGDIVKSVDGKPISSSLDFLRQTGIYDWGDKAKIVIERDGKEQTISAFLRRSEP